MRTGFRNPPSTWRRLTELVALTALGATTVVACSNGPGQTALPHRTGGTTSTAVSNWSVGDAVEVGSFRLISYDSCEGLLARFRTRGAEFYAQRLEPGPFTTEPAAVPRGANDATIAAGGFANESTATTELGAGSDPDHSTPNAVESGVGEADTAVTNGTHLYVARGDQVVVFDVSGGGLSAAGQISVDGSVTNLVVVGPTLYAFGFGAGSGTTSASPGGDMWRIDAAMAQPQQSAVWRIDIADPSAPQLTETSHLDGAITAARVGADGRIRLVVVTGQPHIEGLVYGSDDAGRASAEKINAEVLARTQIEDWLPDIHRDGGSELLVDCAGVYSPPEWDTLGVTSVVTFAATDGMAAAVGAAVVDDSANVYAGLDSVVVSTSNWTESQTSSVLHRFSTTGDDVRYTGAGEVEGNLLHNFSISERNGVVRVATTRTTAGGTTDSVVSTLDANAPDLRLLGEVGGLGPGETIFAVRYVEDLAYVVTFRRIDPLYIVDLRDPTTPRLAGELKIPGYSHYLHPLTNGRLLGVGQGGDEAGNLNGVEISLFDVSTDTPVRLSSVKEPNAFSSSEGDHHAFLYWAPTNEAFVPYVSHGVTESGQPGSESGLLVVGIEGDQLVEHARISAPPVAPPGCPPGGPSVSDGPWCGFQPDMISRSVIAGGSLYLIGNGAVTKVSLNGWGDQIVVTFDS